MKKFILIAVLLYCGCFIAIAQPRIVKGVVSDEYGTIPGITVVVKGTSNGSVTDLDGSFSIVCTPKDELVFSGVGYKTEIVSVGSLKIINVTLKFSDDAVIITPSNCYYAYVASQKLSAVLFENKKLSYRLQELNA